MARKTAPRQAKAKPTGRPSSFTQEIADTICERLADGESLRSICDDAAMPDKATVFRWLAAEANQSFRDQYGRAREAQADSFADDTLTIADDGRNDWMRKKFGDEERYVENGEAIRRSQLRIDTRKWLAGKMAPKKYGDKQQLEHSGPNGGPIETKDVSDGDRARALAAFIAKTKAAK